MDHLLYNHEEVSEIRIAFRTTIEKELLDTLKKEAIDRGVNANDILERLIEENLVEAPQKIKDFRELGYPEQIKFLSDEVMSEIDKKIYEYRYDYRGLARGIISDIVFSVLYRSFSDDEEEE